MKKRIIISIISAVLLIGVVTTGVILYNSSSTSSKGQINKNELTYKGKTNSTVLSLLQKTAKVVTSGKGLATIVTSINDVKADSTKNQQWSYTVNGKTAAIGAFGYITKSSDTITWKLTNP